MVPAREGLRLAFFRELSPNKHIGEVVPAREGLRLGGIEPLFPLLFDIGEVVPAREGLRLDLENVLDAE